MKLGTAVRNNFFSGIMVWLIFYNGIQLKASNFHVSGSFLELDYYVKWALTECHPATRLCQITIMKHAKMPLEGFGTLLIFLFYPCLFPLSFANSAETGGSV